jgi:hypothetical protein
LVALLQIHFLRGILSGSIIQDFFASATQQLQVGSIITTSRLEA